MKSEFTLGSLFAGIGGFDIALERTGMICKLDNKMKLMYT